MGGTQPTTLGLVPLSFAHRQSRLPVCPPLPPSAPPAMPCRVQDYISAMRLLGNTSRSIGDLILVYKRVTGLAGGTPSGMGGGRGMQGGSGPSRHLHPGSPATSVRAGSAPGSTHGWLATPRPQATPAA
jgi:hypothetical protein